MTLGINFEDALVVTLYLFKLVSKFQLADEFKRTMKSENFIPEDSIQKHFTLLNPYQGLDPIHDGRGQKGPLPVFPL